MNKKRDKENLPGPNDSHRENTVVMVDGGTTTVGVVAEVDCWMV